MVIDVVFGLIFVIFVFDYEFVSFCMIVVKVEDGGIFILFFLIVIVYVIVIGINEFMLIFLGFLFGIV